MADPAINAKEAGAPKGKLLTLTAEKPRKSDIRRARFQTLMLYIQSSVLTKRMFTMQKKVSSANWADG